MQRKLVCGEYCSEMRHQWNRMESAHSSEWAGSTSSKSWDCTLRASLLPGIQYMHVWGGVSADRMLEGVGVLPCGVTPCFALDTSSYTLIFKLQRTFLFLQSLTCLETLRFTHHWQLMNYLVSISGIWFPKSRKRHKQQYAAFSLHNVQQSYFK